MKIDSGRPEFEAYVTETEWVKADILFVCKHLAKWMKDKSIPGT